MQFEPFELERTFAKYEHQPGMNVLGASDAETLTVDELLLMSRVPLDLGRLPLGYGDTKGLSELRQTIAESYQLETVGPENVLVTVGASEAIFLSLHTILKPGDTALVCKPAYQGLYEMASAAGARVLKYDYIDRNAEFEPNLDVIHKTLKGTKPPKLLVINSPHNPTGHSFDDASLQQLIALARSFGTRVLVDEVFSGVLIEAKEKSRSALAWDKDVRVIGCLSKVYGLAGLRVGWLVGPKEFIQECIDLRYYTVLVPPSIVQQLGKIAIENKPAILKRTQDNVTDNYNYFKTWIKSYEDLLEWFRPRAGLVMLLRLKRETNTAGFADELANKHGVFLVPCSTCFDMPEGFLRLGLGGNTTEFRKGLEGFGNYVRKQKW